MILNSARSLTSKASVLLVTAASVALTGCALGNMELSGPVQSPQTVSINLSGKVHGGQQPVAGAVIQLYVAGSTGYGSAPTGLITNATYQTTAGEALTDANGNFNISGEYSCPAAPTNATATSPYVYLTATGGNPGLGATNPAIRMVAALGTCSSLSSSTTLFVDEVTTAAAAFALGQYASGDNIGAPNTVQGQIGLANAFATVNNLVNNTTGNAQTSITNGPVTVVPEYAKLYTIADILAACVNSQGITDPTNTSCVTLFADVIGTGYPSTIGTPTDIFEAAVDMNLNPTSAATPGGTSNIAALYGLATGTGAPYTAGSQPGDWTIGIAYSNSSALYPLWVAVDGIGNIWVADQSGTSAGGLTQMSPTGTVLSSPTTLGGITLLSAEPRTVSVDATPVTNGGNYSPNVFIDNYATSPSAILEYNPTSNTAGTIYSTSKSVYGGVLDASNNLWISSNSSSAHFQIIELPAGQTLESVATGATPTATVAEAYGFPNIPTTSNAVVTNGGTAAFQPEYMAFDSSGNLWISAGTASAAQEPYLVELSNISVPAIGTGAGQCPITTSSSTPCFGPISATAASPYLTTSPTYNSAFGVSNYNGDTNQGATQATTTNNTYTYTTSGLGGLNAPTSLAAAAGGVIWAANNVGVSISKITSTTAGTAYGAANGGNTYLLAPRNVAVDGAGSVWVSNKVGSITGGSVGGSVSEFNSAGTALSPASTNTATTNPGFVHSGLNQAIGIAVDLSGNVWVAGNSSTDTVVEIVGAATPIITPIALQLTAGFGKP